MLKRLSRPPVRECHDRAAVYGRGTRSSSSRTNPERRETESSPGTRRRSPTELAAERSAHGCHVVARMGETLPAYEIIREQSLGRTHLIRFSTRDGNGHDAARAPVIEHFSVARPNGLHASIGRDGALVAELREPLQVDLVSTGFVGRVGDPSAVRRVPILRLRLPAQVGCLYSDTR